MKIFFYSFLFFGITIKIGSFFVDGTSNFASNDILPKLHSIIRDEKNIRTFCNGFLSSESGKFYRKPSSCADLFDLGYTTSGIYMISPKLEKKVYDIQVYCDMETDGGGWTVFQRRGQFREPSINFTRSWTEYVKGFGNLFEEFWLGLDYIHILNSQGNMALRIDLKDFEGNSRYARYENFSIGGSKEFYKFTVENFSGDAGDAFTPHSGKKFVTFDMNDVNNCSKIYKGGWWYAGCHHSNLNGLNLKGKHESYADGINWHEWLGYHYSLKYSEMKVRTQTYVKSISLDSFVSESKHLVNENSRKLNPE